MVSRDSRFDLLPLGILVGLAVLLYGVSLNAGQSMNGPMLAGSLIVVVVTFLFAYGAWAIEGGDSGGH